MSNNLNVLIIGAGKMSLEYAKVLQGMGIIPTVIGRGKENAKKFEDITGIKVKEGGVENNGAIVAAGFSHAVVAVNIANLKETVCYLLEHNIKNILVEKPAGMNRQEIEEIALLSERENAKVWVAYNRRYYASTQKAQEIIKSDGGVSSFSFEFTEWGHIVKDVAKDVEWFLANSTHVVDLAFYLGGNPVQMASYVKGSLPWHINGSNFTGAGVTDKDALFSYAANWEAPGRWAVEILTKKHRLYFRPLEKLQIQELASVQVEEVEIDDEVDRQYKAGLYNMVKDFLQEESLLPTIQEQCEHCKMYNKIIGINN